VYPGPNLTVEEYEASLKPINTFGTVQVSVNLIGFSESKSDSLFFYRTFGACIITCLYLDNSAQE
jgi:hypothetical protein